MQMLQFINHWPLLRRLLGKIPGPLLAKLTRLWKTYHLLRGTYEDKLKSLHALHGPLVQVAPREFSWEFDPEHDRQQLRSFEKFNAIDCNIARPEAVTDLSIALRMDRLNLNEHLLGACDDRLLDLLADAANENTPVDMTHLLTRYAWDVMMTMTTGQRAGFLDCPPKSKNVLAALANWKFHSILHGSYLRYHPLIRRGSNLLRFRSQGRDSLDPVMEVLARANLSPSSSGTELGDDSLAFPIDSTESRVALALAGADPAVSLMFQVLKTISQDDTLQQQLVAEVAAMGLSTPITFQSLITRKLNMPRMFALIQHISRAQHLSDLNLSFDTGRGARIGGFVVGEGNTIHVRGADSFTTTSQFNSPQALDPGLAPELNRNLPAYNLWNRDHALENCHVILAAKLASRILWRFHITSNDGGKHIFVAQQDSTDQLNSHSRTTNDKNAVEITSNTEITPSDMDILGENLGPDLTAELFHRFDPSPGATFGESVIIVGPINHSGARALMHKALERIYGGLLKHKTDANNYMLIAAATTRLDINTKPYLPAHGSRSAPRKKFRYQHVYPWYKAVAMNRQRLAQNISLPTAAGPHSPSSAPAQTATVADTSAKGGQLARNQAWTGWAGAEHQKSLDAKSAESYARQQQNASAGSNTDPKPPMRFKETFKQTAPNSNGTGPRLVLRVDMTVRDTNGTTTLTSNDGDMLEPPVKAEAPASAVRPEGWLPPHKRAEEERKRKRLAEEAFAAAALSQPPQSISPLYQAAGTAMFVPSAALQGQSAPSSSATPLNNSEATSRSRAPTTTRRQSVASSASLWGILSDPSSN